MLDALAAVWARLYARRVGAVPSRLKHLQLIPHRVPKPDVERALPALGLDRLLRRPCQALAKADRLYTDKRRLIGIGHRYGRKGFALHATAPSIFAGKHEGEHPPRDGRVGGVFAAETQRAVVTVDFPEHSFGHLAHGRAARRPSPVAPSIDCPKVPLAVRVVARVEGVERLNQLPHPAPVGVGQCPEPLGRHRDARHTHCLPRHVVEPCDPLAPLRAVQRRTH